MHKGPKADIYADHSVDRDERVLATAAVSLLSAPRGILRFSCKPPHRREAAAGPAEIYQSV